jgi:hypothetical protein
MQKCLWFIACAPIIVWAWACSESDTSKKTELSISHLEIVPQNTNILVYANLGSLQQTPFGRDLRTHFDESIKEGEENKEYREFSEKTGVKIEEDIDEIWLMGVATDSEASHGGAIIKGDFDEERIMQYVQQQEPGKLSEQTYLGYKVYSFDDDDSPKSFTFLGQQTVVFGNEDWLKSVLQNTKDGKNVLENSAMSNFIREVPYKDQLWGIVNLSELSDTWAENIRKKGSGFKGTESIENMKAVIFSTRFDDKADLFIKGTFETSEEAELLADMLNGFKSMAKLMVSDDKEAIDMLNGIKIRSSGQDIQISTQVEQGFIDKLKKKQKEFSSGNMKLL